MSLLTVEQLTHSYANGPLYQNAGFQLSKGEHIGVVGQNGAGKSTLLRILLGEVTPDSGRIRWQRRVRVGHLDQHAQIDGAQSVEAYLHTAFAGLYRLEQEMNRLYEAGDLPSLDQAAQLQEQLLAQDFYSAGSRVRRVACGLGLDALGLDTPVERLSGGQRTKVILAKLLLDSADILLLDEPTNYLDRGHVDWLAHYLAGLESAFLVVSHDQSFLERTATGILDLEFASIRKYCGGFAHYANQKEALQRDYSRRYSAQQQQIQRTEAYIRKSIAGVHSKNAQGRRKQLERLERLAPPQASGPLTLRFSPGETLTDTALRVRGLQVGYSKALLPPVSFTVAPGQVLAITGFNGIGKSTLLKTLVGLLPSLGGGFRFAPRVQVGYSSQEMVWDDPAKTPLQIVQEAYPAMDAGEARRALAGCDIKMDHALQPVGSLSGGEQAKAKLCLLLLQRANFLVLDEPTSHLDARTKEALKKALAEFSGGVLLVCHEEEFYCGMADQVLDFTRLSRDSRSAGLK